MPHADKFQPQMWKNLVTTKKSDTVFGTALSTQESTNAVAAFDKTIELAGSVNRQDERTLFILSVGAGNGGRYGNPSHGNSAINAKNLEKQGNAVFLGSALQGSFTRIVELSFSDGSERSDKWSTRSKRFSYVLRNQRFPLLDTDQATIGGKIERLLDGGAFDGRSRVDDVVVMFNFVTDYFYPMFAALLGRLAKANRKLPQNSSRNVIYVNQYLQDGEGVDMIIKVGAQAGAAYTYKLPKLDRLPEVVAEVAAMQPS